MTTFDVWAPAAERVDLCLGDGSGPEERVAMVRRPRGWWRAPVEPAAGARYGFSLDGGPVRPDPRSASQPDGVHGRSEVVDHAAFEWTDQGWRGCSLRGAVIYELHVGTFSGAGTFDGVVDHLDHLVDLGVDAIELMPVVEFPGRRGWGYDGVDLFAPHHAWGGPEGLKRLVDGCHGRGLGVVVDVVYNHLGPSGNYLAEFGPYFTELHRTDWGAAVNYDGAGSDEVRRLVVDNALSWLRDYHADGLRLDAVHAIWDDSPCHVLEELAAEVDALAVRLGRPLGVVAESSRNDPRLVQPRESGGYGLDGVWSDDWHHAVHAVLTGERTGYYEDFGSVVQLAKALRQAWVYDGGWSIFRGRRHGGSPRGIAGDRFVVCTQNHDQVGNRAAGDRLAALVSEGRLRVAAGLLLTGPFTPLLFQGEEWGASTPFCYFTDHDDPELGRTVSEGRRKEFAAFGWDPEDVPDPQDPCTFERSRLDWSEVGRPPHAGLLEWYRTLVTLRRRLPALRDPRADRVRVDADEASRTLVVRRGGVRVLANLGHADHCFELPVPADILAASDPGIGCVDGGLLVPPDALAVVEDESDG